MDAAGYAGSCGVLAQHLCRLCSPVWGRTDGTRLEGRRMTVKAYQKVVEASRWFDRLNSACLGRTRQHCSVQSRPTCPLCRQGREVWKAILYFQAQETLCLQRQLHCALSSTTADTVCQGRDLGELNDREIRRTAFQKGSCLRLMDNLSGVSSPCANLN
jgi:hypothetical protein